MKKKLIEIKTDKRTIEIILNKKAWHKLTASIIIFILIFITLLAIIFLVACPMAMVEAWSISGAPLIVFIFCLAWLGIMVYIFN